MVRLLPPPLLVVRQVNFFAASLTNFKKKSNSNFNLHLNCENFDNWINSCSQEGNPSINLFVFHTVHHSLYQGCNPFSFKRIQLCTIVSVVYAYSTFTVMTLCSFNFCRFYLYLCLLICLSVSLFVNCLTPCFFVVKKNMLEIRIVKTIQKII